jgi:hypothetical protein
MNRLALSALAVFAFSPIAVFAQNQPAQDLSAQTQAAAPVLYAEANAPAVFSSSLISDELAAPASSAAGAASAAASAADAHSGSVKPFSALGVGVKIGTGGIGFDAAVPLLSRLNVRGGAGFFNYTYNGNIDNDPISATLKLNNAEVMVDLFPFNGSFRLSAGTTVYNTTGLNGTGSIAGGSKISVGNSTYISNPANPVTIGVVAGFGGKAVPRFTLGWGNMVAKNHRIRFETEFGVEVIGTPTAVWTYSGSACMSNSNGSACTSAYAPIAPADISVQNADLENDLTNLKVFPIISFGLSVKLGHK